MVLLAGARLGFLPGASLAAAALTISQLVESAWLWRAVRSMQQRLREQVQVKALPSSH